MNIGIDGNEANQTNRVGVGQFAFNVISELEKLDKKNSYTVYLKNSPQDDLPKERVGWKYKVFGPSKLWTQFSLPIKLFTQKEKLSVFYSPSHYSPRVSPFPRVISIMDLWHHRHPEQFAKKDLYQLTAWEKYSVKSSQMIITISEFSKKEIIHFYQYPEKKIVVAYPGFEKFKIKDKENKIEKIREKYKIGEDYLLYLGTLQPKKNILGLIEAFAEIATKFPNVLLVIAGKKGWLYEEVFKKVRSLGIENRIIFPGFVSEEEKPYLLSGAKAFILPSFYEGFGIPVLEAMSLGVPLAISNQASLPEVGGDAAVYFDPYNLEEVKLGITKVLNLNTSQRNEIIKKGKIQAQKFSWASCATKILTALETFK